jgi:hypothetical protein
MDKEANATLLLGACLIPQFFSYIARIMHGKCQKI